MKYLTTLMAILLLGCGAEDTSSRYAEASLQDGCKDVPIFQSKTIRARWNMETLAQVTLGAISVQSDDMVTAPNSHIMFLTIACAVARMAQEIDVVDASSPAGKELFKKYLLECAPRVGLKLPQ